MALFSRFSALCLLLLLSPLLLFIGLCSFLLQGWPILFSQTRIGFQFQPFSLYKFRSMAAEKQGGQITDANDPRITAWGHLLRTVKLDELPQLWNILRGDMRFVGPRPEVAEFVNPDDFGFLERIKPGLTDFSSILFRNEAQVLAGHGGVEHYPELLKVKVRLGELYADHKHFWLDLALLKLTFLAIFFPQAATTAVKKYFIQRYDPGLIETIDEWLNPVE